MDYWQPIYDELRAAIGTMARHTRFFVAILILSGNCYRHSGVLNRL
jgi:hypothetical protein